MAIKFHVAEFVDAEKIDSSVTGDGLSQDFVVDGLDQLVDQHARVSQIGTVADSIDWFDVVLSYAALKGQPPVPNLSGQNT
ncbi:hypothetical protein ACIRG5_38845 [Lentzea sp. NPDC102401]|uniref:hypothetical protein n=1 Tax=Lentzea sp. NPDC102401 TaxID=3364128 RepID=UPI00382ADA8F